MESNGIPMEIRNARMEEREKRKEREKGVEYNREKKEREKSGDSIITNLRLTPPHIGIKQKETANMNENGQLIFESDKHRSSWKVKRRITSTGSTISGWMTSIQNTGNRKNAYAQTTTVSN